MDQDEATYFEIGRQLLLGKVLYVDYIDIKPPGMFWIMAGFQFLFGHSIFMIRLMSALWIGLTAWVIYRVIRLMINDNHSALAGGVMYIFMVSCWAFYGVSINTEIFFNLFTIASLYFLLKNKGWWTFLFAGLLAGIGFIIKYVMLFDFAAFILFLLFTQYFQGRQKGIAEMFLKLMATGLAFLIPFSLLNLYYLQSGHYEAFREIVFEAPARYPSEMNLVEMIVFIFDFILRFFPILFFYFYVLFKRDIPVDGIGRFKILSLVWTLLVLLAVIIPGNTYGHYTVQLMLPVSVLASVFFHSAIQRPLWLKGLISRRAGLILLPVISLVIIILQKIEFYDNPDIPKEVAAYLAPRMNEKDLLYTGNYNHIIYYLLKKESPTPYLHQSLLIQDRHIGALQIDTRAEFSRIMALRPLYILSKGVYPNESMEPFIRSEYYLEHRLGKNVHIYRLKAQ
jgi:4-amino-4-deoxy-L-arabinose transferase-like glycosyltransferase